MDIEKCKHCAYSVMNIKENRMECLTEKCIYDKVCDESTRDEVRRVFISLPMQGKTEEEIRKRRDEIMETVVTVFRGDFTWELIDQMDKPEELKDAPIVALLGHSIMQMAKADLVVFDKYDWEENPGVDVERNTCSHYDIPSISIWELEIYLKFMR